MREIHEYVEAGCKLADPILIFAGIYQLTNGQPCNGCSYKNGCTAIHKINTTKNAKKSSLMTNAQLASELGISKRQVSKLRIPGTNEIAR